MRVKHLPRSTWSWALYDWANSAFATTVMAGFFPVFFKQYWSNASDASVSTFQLGVANAIASLAIVLTAPIMGAVADQSGSRKRFLMLFSVLGILATAALFLVTRGEWVVALALFVTATIGFMGANVFYDALIVAIAEEERDFVSGLGYALGYLGGGLLFAVNVAMVLQPALFGIEDAAQAIRWSFLTVAIWWLIFSIPLWCYVDEPARTHATPSLRAGIRQLQHTLSAVGRHRVALLFLVAYWFYIDGVDTIIRMAVDFGLSIGFSHNDLILALLITQLVGFPAALAFGALGTRFGAKPMLLVAVGVYILITLWAFRMDDVKEFYALAVVVGLVQGGVQALSRSLYSRLIPAHQSGEFFGFYNMLGKSAAVLGPLMIGAVSYATESHRLGILSIIVLFVIGGVLLWRVDVQRGEELARAGQAQY